MTATDTNVVRFIELPRLRGRVGHTSLSGHDHTVPSWVGVVHQQETLAPQQSSCVRHPVLFDDLCGLPENKCGHGQSELPGSLEVDLEIKLRGLFKRQLGGLGPLSGWGLQQKPTGAT